ncbi:molecular chaperone [Volvox carteri f. nagariensis]|uniref:Molecular chaperone n=1 Tax=Volvox carteri f. nagariensis TaxID=3068 RepID=D8U022_VOLCA|nr:molecular chaperone [Volvox carteri f. nagariensis]EFJ46862.1 molecular chaperone [Volvox carteri f. nagariensis]|eukprot:XP_002952071.1 molecular chaperone [Volvox carteri f. nagariensis]
MPFWCISTEASVTLHSAQIGRDYVATRYNPMTRRHEPRWETAWHTVAPNWRYSRRWTAESEETQIYGGSKYRNDTALGRMRPGEYVRQALTYGDYVRRTADKEQPERLIPFRLSPDEAVEAAKQAIRQSELRAAEHQLLQTYGGDRVQLVVLEVELGRLSATPVFSPVYVFKTRVRGTAMRTYVAVAAAAAVAGPLALLASGAVGPGISLPAALLVGVGLPYLLAYGLASLWPELHSGFLRLRARLQRPLPDAAQDEQERWWRYEWVKQDTNDWQGYSYSDEGRYSHSYRRPGAGGEGGSRGASGAEWGWQQDRSGAGGAGQQKQRQEATGRAAPGSDPKGYYHILGVSPSSSTEEIQAAFRAAALKWHPDRQPDPARKAESTRQFQSAQEAYSVLRDPNRRAAYDRGFV